MRTSAFLAAATAILLAPPASAATIVVNYTIFIGGAANQNFSSSLFPGFDPSLGTLNSVAESVTGSTIWLPGGNSAQLLMLLSRTPANQTVSASFNVTQTVDISLNGVENFGFPGPGLIQETLRVSDISSVTHDPLPGILGSATLDGTVTYTYTPLLGSSAIPEPSTWAMMLIGFSGLGYAAFRRKRAVRAVLG